MREVVTSLDVRDEVRRRVERRGVRRGGDRGAFYHPRRSSLSVREVARLAGDLPDPAGPEWCVHRTAGYRLTTRVSVDPEHRRTGSEQR